jgi:peptide/nickel transport system ATP-binding protein
MSLLEVKGLRVFYYTRRGIVRAVDGVSFTLDKSDFLGLAGESGCGKTTLGLSLMMLVPRPGKIVGGEILFEGKNITKMNEEELRKLRWRKISMIFQGAMEALNPLMKVGDQIVEAILAHRNMSKDQARKRAEELLRMVAIDPMRIDDYPFMFSGGMRQRALIAMALACDPDLVIADEPTTALDVIVQAQLLNLLKDLQKKLKISMILISHNLPIISQMCNKIAVMYAGKIVEWADRETLLYKPLHPYTKGLLNATPSLDSAKTGLKYIRGNPPDLLNPPTGCRFHPRCEYAMEICHQKEPMLLQISRNHFVACHLF